MVLTSLSKLELLEQELETIKQAVSNPGKEASTTQTPPSPRKQLPFSNFSAPASTIPSIAPAMQAPVTAAVQTHTPLSDAHVPIGSKTQFPDIPARTEPTKARMLGEHVVTGEDIDWYFTKYALTIPPNVPVPISLTV